MTVKLHQLDTKATPEIGAENICQPYAGDMPVFSIFSLEQVVQCLPNAFPKNKVSLVAVFPKRKKISPLVARYKRATPLNLILPQVQFMLCVAKGLL